MWFLCGEVDKTYKRESPQEAWPSWENSSLGCIEAVHQWYDRKMPHH